MSSGLLEHVNITVSNSEATAELLCRLFDWHIRWAGPSVSGGHTVHVGTDDIYLAVFSPDGPAGSGEPARSAKGRAAGVLNHVGIVVADLDDVERRVKREGFETFSHGNYEPGRRFYFLDGDGVEFEIVSYA